MLCFNLPALGAELPRELFRLDWRQFLTMWSLNPHDADAVAIAEHLVRLVAP
jgi:hypothetical protein